QDLEAARLAAGKAQKDSAARIASLQDELSRRSADTESLSSKLAVDEAALKGAGDSAGRAQALSADLDQARRDLAATRAQLADATKAADAAKADTSGGKAALERQVADLTDKLVAASRSYAALQQENSVLRRSSPIRPAAVAAARQAPPPAPTP